MSAEFPFAPEFQAVIPAFLWRIPAMLPKYMDKLQLAYFQDANDSTIVSYLYKHQKDYKKSPAKSTLLEYIRQAYPDADKNSLHKKSIENLSKRVEAMDVADLSDTVFIEEQLKAFIQFESLKAFAIETVNKIQRKEYDPNLPKLAREALDAGVQDDDLGTDWVRTSVTRVGNATNPDHEPRIPTGVHHLDLLINGGLKAGELGILLGLPKGFKSGCLANFAFSAMKVAQGQHVAYVTLELSEDLVGLRFDFRTAMMNREQLLTEPDKFLNVLQARQDILFGNNRLFIKQFKTKTASCDTLRIYLDKLQQFLGQKIGMLIVDYLDLLKPTKKREKSYQEDVDICEDLRDIANEYRFPCWTACRATREAVGKKRISMAHMSRAFERVGVADLMIALCQTEKEKADKLIRLYLAAARNNEGEKMVNCKLDYEKMLIKSEGVSEPEYEDEGEQRKGRRRPEGPDVNWDQPPKS